MQRHGGRGCGMIGNLKPCALALSDLGKAMSIAAGVDAPAVTSDLDVGKACYGRSGQRLRARAGLDVQQQAATGFLPADDLGNLARHAILDPPMAT